MLASRSRAATRSGRVQSWRMCLGESIPPLHGQDLLAWWRTGSWWRPLPTVIWILEIENSRISGWQSQTSVVVQETENRVDFSVINYWAHPVIESSGQAVQNSWNCTDVSGQRQLHRHIGSIAEVRSFVLEIIYGEIILNMKQTFIYSLKHSNLNLERWGSLSVICMGVREEYWHTTSLYQSWIQRELFLLTEFPTLTASRPLGRLTVCVASPLVYMQVNPARKYHTLMLLELHPSFIREKWFPKAKAQETASHFWYSYALIRWWVSLAPCKSMRK